MKRTQVQLQHHERIQNEYQNKMKKSEIRQYIKDAREEEIEPSASVKNRLDDAFRSKRKKTRLQMPMYQSVAAAVLFLLAGVGIGRFFEKPQPVV